MYNYIFNTKVHNFYDNSANRQCCWRHVVCIIQIHMPCRLLVLHAPLYTNIVDRKSGPFGGNLDKNAKNWLEQGALAIFWRFLTPGNKWCLDWSWFRTIYPIPIFDILFPFPVTNPSPSGLNPIFPGQIPTNPTSHFTPSGPSAVMCICKSLSQITWRNKLL